MGAIYEKMIRPALFRMDPEQAHDLGRNVLVTLGRVSPLCLALRWYNRIEEDRSVRLFGLKFKNRVGLAAGMDKDGEFPRAAEALGFGHAEVGTVTPKPQPGNPRPRLFRYPEEGVLVNRMGFNNQGAEAMAKTLRKRYPQGERDMPVGVNIGKAKATPLDHALDDYVACFRALADQADYFTVNFSSPNTPGLRELQTGSYLSGLLRGIRDENNRHAKKLGRSPHPLLVKIAPDLSFPEIDRILEILFELEFDGVVATNSTTDRPAGFASRESGGLSGGAFLHKRSTEIINYIHRATEGKLPIIGVGGIDSPESAGETLDAGASLIQVYTGWVYRGPFLARELGFALRARGRKWIR